MRILICDDDPLIHQQLKRYITGYFDMVHVKCPEIVCYSSGESLLSDTGEMDILFLDIEMTGLNGIIVGNELKKKNDKIIIFIVTSYAQYLDDAMRFHVFRYLSKPVEQERFNRNMIDALNLYNSISIRIPIETKQGLTIIPASSIVTVEVMTRKVIVHTIERDYESKDNVQYWIDILPKNCFFQSHRSYIVNFEHIADFDRSIIHMMPSKFNAYLTKRKYNEFKEAYLLYLESMR